ncbi:unnamed protein product [Adineta steineri]|uniref:Uncharacterized protein n=1 Tax=Adineta steineri TaxID=433720 RepID=A0A814Y244_9BILA|nr:unnamed protein product [Adineta steineri]CAF1223572.1 unnamed protein product [Adineta steineri]
MKSIILASAIIMACLSLSYGYDCRCACCLTTIWNFNCTPVNQPVIDVANCPSCIKQLCTDKYPTQCPAENSFIKNSCNSTHTSGSSYGQQILVPLLILPAILSFCNIAFDKFADMK